MGTRLTCKLLSCVLMCTPTRARPTRVDISAALLGARYAPKRRLRAFAHRTPPAASAPPTASAARVCLAGGKRHPTAQLDGLLKTRIGQPRSTAILRRSLSGLTAYAMPDGLEHGDVGDRVAVGVAVLEVVADLLGELLDRARLLLGVGVVLDLAGVLAVHDLHPGRDHPVGAEHLRRWGRRPRRRWWTRSRRRARRAWCSSIRLTASS